MNPQVNSAIKRISNIANELNEQLSTIDKYSYEKLTECVDNIEAKKAELAELGVKFKEAERTEKVDLQLRLKENENQLLDKLAATHNMHLMPRSEYQELTQQVSEAEKMKAEAVKIATASLERKLSTDFKLKDSENVINIATLQAQIQQFQKNEEFLNKEVSRLTKELAEAGERMVSIANANNSSAITVTK